MATASIITAIPSSATNHLACLPCQSISGNVTRVTVSSGSRLQYCSIAAEPSRPGLPVGMRISIKRWVANSESSLLAETSRDLVKQTDLLYKLACRLIETCENECDAKGRDTWAGRDINRARKAADEARALAVDQLKQVRSFWKQAHWLTERFPEAQLRDVAGLVKLVDLSEIAANDWSLTPGRYVGVAPEEEDEDFDFEEALRDIHVELEDLNAEAVPLAATIKRNFEELGV